MRPVATHESDDEHDDLQEPPPARPGAIISLSWRELSLLMMACGCLYGVAALLGDDDDETTRRRMMYRGSKLVIIII